MVQTLKEVMGNIHWHFEVIAYDNKLSDGRMENGVEINILEAKTEEEAMEIAKNKIKRPYYFLRKAWQCKQCAFQEEMINQMKKAHE